MLNAEQESIPRSILYVWEYFTSHWIFFMKNCFHSYEFSPFRCREKWILSMACLLWRIFQRVSYRTDLAKRFKSHPRLGSLPIFKSKNILVIPEGLATTTTSLPSDVEAHLTAHDKLRPIKTNSFKCGEKTEEKEEKKWFCADDSIDFFKGNKKSNLEVKCMIGESV